MWDCNSTNQGKLYKTVCFFIETIFNNDTTLLNLVNLFLLFGANPAIVSVF